LFCDIVIISWYKSKKLKESSTEKRGKNEFEKGVAGEAPPASKKVLLAGRKGL
jgi:hypothetical protein